MGTKEKAAELGNQAPSLTEKNIAEINALYPVYIFRRKRTRELWTSCCGHHEVAPKGAYDAVMSADHTPEERGYQSYGCHCGYQSAREQKKPQKVRCPFCGAEATVKELGRTGERGNLAAYRRFVVFKAQRGALWAVAYDSKKRYKSEFELTEKPTIWKEKVYRFKIGAAESAGKSCYAGALDYFVQMKERPKKLPLPIHEPFTQCTEYGMGYDLIARDEIGKSPFKYCGFDEFELKSVDIMRFFAVCAIYPRQVEMLMKCGQIEAVQDLVYRKKWNAAAFDWEEKNPLKAFGLSKPELKEFLETRMGLDSLARYKQFRRAGISCTLGDVRELNAAAQNKTGTEIAAKLKKYKLSPRKWLNYIEKERTEIKRRKKRTGSAYDFATWWNDYIDAAQVLGYDLGNPVFLMPKGLTEKHDKATSTATAILDSRRDDDRKKKELKRLRELAPRYTFSTERWVIRPPLGAAEIVAEGKALKHCVGGYADRHVAGSVVILLLRDRLCSRKPLVTIEMRGNDLVQIHGWDDERTKSKENPKREDPRTLYAEIMDPFLAWVKNGYRRTKKGYPITKRGASGTRRIAPEGQEKAPWGGSGTANLADEKAVATQSQGVFRGEVSSDRVAEGAQRDTAPKTKEKKEGTAA